MRAQFSAPAIGAARANDSRNVRHSFHDRFGPRIVACGMTPVPTLLIRRGVFFLGLTHAELHYCLYVFSLRWSDRWPYVPNITASQALGYDDPQHSAIKKIKSSLQAKGYLVAREAHRRHDGKRGGDIIDLSGLLAALERDARDARIEDSMAAYKNDRPDLPVLPASRYAGT